ncbi:MAG: hypothetical protein IT163_07650 [Bryobacterales bacterium]|nr:hypothetical protein [Bryobacterales bacterium]
MLLLFYCLFLAVSGLLGAQQVSGGNTTARILRPSEDNVLPAIRAARNKRFNVRLPYSMLEPFPSGVGYPSVSYKFTNFPELPIQEADTVVVGTVTDVQPFLSEDRKGIYTEYKVNVTEVLKISAPTVVRPGLSMTLARAGGAAQLLDGHEVKHRITNDVVPTNRKEYLLFLIYEPTLETFDYIKLWLIEDGALRPVCPDDIGRRHSGTSQYAGISKVEVLRLIKAKLNR